MSRPVPDHEVRINPRAKRLTLRVLPGRGLVVSAPPRVPRREITAFVVANGAWARQALAEADARQPEACREWPPRQLDLAAIGRRVVIGFLEAGQPSAQPGTRAEPVLELALDSRDRLAVAKAVSAWLRPLAREHLLPRLATLAQRHGLIFARSAIRGQRTVWGSYSARGTLSLNYKLLFLPAELVDYVLLHELAHTRHLDHSPRFWALLERCLPDARDRHRRLRKASQRVPAWLERVP